MTKSQRLVRYAWAGPLALLILSLTACGGGGGTSHGGGGDNGGGDNGGGTTNNRTLAGQVTSSVSQQPISGATVAAAGRTAVTGPDGRYSLTGLPDTGALTVTFTASGYTPRSVDVPDPAQAQLDVTLVPTSTGDDSSGPPPPPDFDNMTR